MKARITADLMKSFGASPFDIWDDKIEGLRARRQTSKGRIRYSFRFADANGMKRNVAIGDGAVMTPDMARAAAKELAGDASAAVRLGGVDPARARDTARAQSTMAQVWADYEKLALHHRAEKVQAHYRSIWTNHLAPRIGHIKAAAISRGDVESLHKAITDMGRTREKLPLGPRGGHPMQDGSPAKRGGKPPKQRFARRRGGKTIANHAVELLSILMNRAEIYPNPCAKVERNRRIDRDIRFSYDDLTCIMEALGEESEPVQVAFDLFLETPQRHDVIASAEGEEFIGLKTDAPVWIIPGAKLKGKRPFRQYISRDLAARIQSYWQRTRKTSPVYLFPRNQGKRAGESFMAFDPKKPRATFRDAWLRIQKRAIQIAKARGLSTRALEAGSPHVFKHTYLQNMADGGASAHEIRGAGDHTDIRTSMIYTSRAVGRQQELQEKARAALPKRGRAA